MFLRPKGALCEAHVQLRSYNAIALSIAHVAPRHKNRPPEVTPAAVEQQLETRTKLDSASRIGQGAEDAARRRDVVDQLQIVREQIEPRRIGGGILGPGLIHQIEHPRIAG